MRMRAQNTFSTLVPIQTRFWPRPEPGRRPRRRLFAILFVNLHLQVSHRSQREAGWPETQFL
jgi:hypothetical protein